MQHSPRAYFSGIEGKMHWNHCVRAGVKHCLTSFLQFWKGSLDIVRQRKLAHPDMKFMIDSGAHTFIVEWEKYTHWTRADFENYLAAYVDWLKKNRQYIEVAVELDIDHTLNMVLGGSANSTVGSSIVEGWQRDYFRPLDESGLPIIFVWHENRGMDGWEEMCRRYAYVGMPGHFSSESDLINRHFVVARRYNAKVHGFAASVTGDSQLVLKSDSGLRACSIETLFKECTSVKTIGDEEWGTLPVTHRTWSLTDNLRSSFEVVTSVVRHKVHRPLYEILLRGGKRIVGTGDHSFFALTAGGHLKEVKPTDLAVGDCLVSSLGWVHSPATQSQGSDLRVAEFMGLWFGDGYVNQRQGKNDMVWVSKQHQPAIRSLCNEIALLFGSTWTLTNNYDGYTYAPELGELLVNNFGRTGNDKFLGSFLLNADHSWQAAFLRGYFSADGSAKGRNALISLTCRKRAPLELVQLLLEAWDIRSGLSQDRRRTGKGGEPCWELAISDSKSRDLFLEHIGFLQVDQVQAIRLKARSKPIAGGHRSLPVNLLREPGRLYRIKDGYLTSRPVYPKDRRTALIPENFCPRLLEMQCEYLEILEINKLSAKTEWVYDLEVPTTQRFFANGILAHNTKQLDFRDMPWYCMTEEHEVLTRRGWCSRAQIKKTDKVLTLSEDGVSSWEQLQNVYTFSVKGVPITHFESRTFNAQVTADHRWPSFRQYQKNRKKVNYFTWRTTKELDNDDRIPRCAPHAFSLQERIYSDAFVELVGWVWTEGCIQRTKANVCTITLSQSYKVNPAKVHLIRRCLTNVGAKYHEWYGADGCVYFGLSGDLKRRLLRLLTLDKVLPLSFVHSLTQEQLHLFIVTSVLADGTFLPRVNGELETFTLGQKNGKNLDVFEIACLLAGYPVSRYTLEGGPYAETENYMEFVSTSNVPWIYPKSARQTEHAYTGNIWCVSVKNQSFLTRCKGKVYWTGNSVDSITWKTGEMYGTLIVWDEHQQKLIFEEDKTQRIKYRSLIKKAGFDADAIIADNNYKEVTRFGLWSMRQMELFYARLYKNRVPYYVVRLPPWKLVKSFSAKKAMRWWRIFRPDVLFKQHATAPAATIIEALAAISAAQAGDLVYIASSVPAQQFLGSYFPRLINPLISDPTVLQKEVANYTAPPNPPPLFRTADEHFRYTLAKLRDEDYSTEELEFNPYMADLPV